MNLALWLFLALWCLVVVGTPLAWAAICIARSLRRRRERRAIQRAIAEGVREVQEQARELGRIASAAQVVHAHQVFAAHRELREGVRARA